MSQGMQFRTPEQAKAYADSMDQHWRKTNAQYGSGAYTPPSITKNQYGQYSVGQQSPGRAQPRQSPYESSTAYQAWNPNIANNPSAPRPPAFQASYGNLDGTTSQQPNFQQRDAFISQINDRLGQMQQQSWQQPMGAPQFDFQGMASRANEMVRGGWQNPMLYGARTTAPQDAAGAQVRRLLPDSSGILGEPTTLGSTGAEAAPAPSQMPPATGDDIPPRDRRPPTREELDRIIADSKKEMSRPPPADITVSEHRIMRKKAMGEEAPPPRRPEPPPPPPGRLEPTPRPAKPRPAPNPFPGMSVALPPGMNMSQFTRQLDGSYLPGGVTKRPSMTPRPPRTINWGEMTPDEIAATRSPYLGGRIPTVRQLGEGSSAPAGQGQMAPPPGRRVSESAWKAMYPGVAYPTQRPPPAGYAY